MMPGIVTIDGASGSGKTTLGRRLAMALGLPFVDTGLLYRALMVAAVRAGLTADDTAGLVELAGRTRIQIDTSPRAAGDQAGTLVDGVPAGDLLRDPSRALLLSTLSGLPGVRSAILQSQRDLAAGGAVAVGRDCGTVVFPQAPVKLFLQASEEVRARRRQAQLLRSGTAVSDIDLRSEIGGRDALDTGRQVSPLRPAEDAHIIDTGVLGVAATVDAALDLCAAAGLSG